MTTGSYPPPRVHRATWLITFMVSIDSYGPEGQDQSRLVPRTVRRDSRGDAERAARVEHIVQRRGGMAWFWIVLSALAGVGGLRYLARLRAGRRPYDVPAVDDAALHEIMRSGRLQGPRRDPAAGMRAAAEAEDEFWSQSWDEPEEYSR